MSQAEDAKIHAVTGVVSGDGGPQPVESACGSGIVETIQTPSNEAEAAEEAFAVLGVITEADRLFHRAALDLAEPGGRQDLGRERWDAAPASLALARVLCWSPQWRRPTREPDGLVKRRVLWARP